MPPIPAEAAIPPTNDSGHAILLVDDNDAVRATAAAYLRECGLAVLEAPDSASALDLLADRRVEALVTDIVMPGEMDGMALAEAARTSWPDLPVLLAGGGFRHGQHLAFDRERNYPLPNLFVSMLQRMGIEADKFASSTGTMRGLDLA